MAVFRVEKSKDFTTMSNYHLRDRSLSLKGKGLLSLMLSLPDNWDYTLNGLAKICKDGVDSIRSAVLELEASGYLRKTRCRNEKGQLCDTEYTIYEKPKREKPILENPILDNPMLAEPILDNPMQLNTKKSNIKEINTDFINNVSINQDAMDTIEIYRNILHENIEYDILCEQKDKELLDEIVEIILECICSSKETICIGKEDIPKEVVKSRFLKINSEHIEYILFCMKRNTTKVRNIKAYLKSVIYNAPTTLNSFYSAEVNHDLYGG